MTWHYGFAFDFPSGIQQVELFSDDLKRFYGARYLDDGGPVAFVLGPQSPKRFLVRLNGNPDNHLLRLRQRVSAFLAFGNLLEAATLTATNDNPDFPVSNLTSPYTWQRWKPGIPEHLLIENLPQVPEVFAFSGFHGDSLELSGVQASGQEDLLITSEAAQGVHLIDEFPIYPRYRLVLEGDNPSLGHAFMGRAFPFILTNDFKPLATRDLQKPWVLNSESGVLLKKEVKPAKRPLTIPVKFLSAEVALGPYSELLETVQTQPFYFCPQAHRPESSFFCWTTQTLDNLSVESGLYHHQLAVNVE